MLQRLIVASLVLGTGTVAVAGPTYSSPLDKYTLGRAKADLIELAQREGIEAETAEILLKLDVFATSSDTGCPGVDVDVINATSHTVWNIEIEISQKDGTDTRKDVVHLPYLTADAKTRVTVSCLQDYTTGSRYSYRDSSPIQLSYNAKGSKSIDLALPLMLERMKDYAPGIGTYDVGIRPTTASTTSLLAEALSMDDADVATELVSAIARTGVGRVELGEAIAAHGEGALADEVVSSMRKLPPAQQAQLARTLLASRVAEKWADQLGPMIDRTLCTGARAEVVGLWIQAQGEDGIPVAAFRDKIRVKCKPTKADGPGLLAALEKDARRTGAVLDAVDPELFASAVASWRAVKPPAIASTLLAFARDTQAVERFDLAIAVVPKHQLAATLGQVIQAPEGPAAARKAAWATATIGTLDESDVLMSVQAATEMLVGGSVPAPALREAIKGFAPRAPKVVEEVLATYANQHSKMFDARALSAAGLDMSEFLAFNANLGDCTATIQNLAACASQIALYKDKAGPGALAKHAQSALKPEFATQMRTLVETLRDPAGLIEISAALQAAGLDASFVAERACRDARDAVTYGGDPDPQLALAEKIAPSAACISDARDLVSSKHRKAVMFSILAIAGLVLPLPAGGWLMRRRWRKVQKLLPGETGPETAAGAKLDDRLGAAVLGRALRDGLGEAKRELAGAAAARSLDGIDDAAIAAVTTTVSRAVKSGDAATLLVKRAGEAVYIVALPVRHARPQIVQRYLGAPWPEHLAKLQATAGTPLLALIVLCGPEAAEATLLVAHTDGTTSTEPEALLDAKEARDRGANRFRHVATLATTTPATPTSTPTSAKAS